MVRMFRLFGRTRELIAQLNAFWDAIADSALHFREGMEAFLSQRWEDLEHSTLQVIALEREADTLRRSIRYRLYHDTLLPDQRGDVLALLETSDNVIDTAKKVLTALEIERPRIPEDLREPFLLLGISSAAAVEEMVLAARAFFDNPSMVNDGINKVYHHEGEADRREDQIKRRAFADPGLSTLSQRVQLRYFAEKISRLSDDAEAVCERLSVYTIKRTL